MSDDLSHHKGNNLGRFAPQEYIGRVQDDGYFDQHVAARYDQDLAETFDPDVVDPMVDLLTELAGSRRVLELGIGTGRIALPLAGRGVSVYGIDLSQAMVSKLRLKPGGKEIGVTIGDFATARAEGISVSPTSSSTPSST